MGRTFERLRRMSFRVGAIAALVWVALPAPPSQAATITVTTTADQNGAGSACSLREAIRSANTDTAVGGCPAGSAATSDLILVPAGVYGLTRVGTGENEAMDGDLDVNGDVTIRGAGAQVTEVDGNGNLTGERVFSVTSSTVRMSGLTVRDGSRGGIGTTGSTVTLLNMIVSDNTTLGGGGGVSVFGGSLVAVGTTISGNQAQDGGGIDTFSSATVTLRETTVADNLATNLGGAIFNGGGSSMVIARSSVRQNESEGTAGGVFNSGPLRVSKSLVSDNLSGDRGGGILNNGRPLEIVSSTISGNHAAGSGGGILALTLGPVTVELHNVTITRNVADADRDGTGDGGGLAGDDSTLTLADSLVAANQDRGGEKPDCAMALTSEGHNLIGANTSCIPEPGSEGDQLGDPSLPIDPRLSPLADNGGPTATHGLLPGSPALNAGHPSGSGTESSCGPADQRGVPRSLGGRCDIGAYELVRCFARPVDVVGTARSDSLAGTDAADVFLGLGGDDTVNAGRGADRACGGRGHDTLRGGGGPDLLAGQEGNDSLDGGPGPDRCVGGPGRDAALRCEVRQSI